MSAILIQPHDDDAVLFACWTLLRLKPLVVTVFDSYVQPARGIPGTTATERAEETRRACEILGVQCERLGFSDGDITADALAIRNAVRSRYGHPGTIIAPIFEHGGHAQHNLVALALGDRMKDCVRYYSYTVRGKSTSANEVPFEPEWVALKLRALAEFKSQFQQTTGCVEHFIGRNLREYTL